MPAVRVRQISMALLMIPDKIQLSRQKMEEIQRRRRQRRPRAAGESRECVNLLKKPARESVEELRTGYGDEK